MRIRCGKWLAKRERRRVAKRRARSRWHSWFAWRPVMLLDGDYAWLERVEKQCVHIWIEGTCPPEGKVYRPTTQAGD